MSFFLDLNFLSLESNPPFSRSAISFGQKSPASDPSRSLTAREAGYSGVCSPGLQTRRFSSEPAQLAGLWVFVAKLTSAPAQKVIAAQKGTYHVHSNGVRK
jgi:hypothetical protein